MKKFIIFVFCLIAFFVFNYIQSTIKANVEICYDSNIRMINDTVPTDTLTIKDTIPIKPNTMIYFLDKKQVSEELINELAEKGVIGNGSGFSNPRTAIRIYGEKARYGIFFFESK